jgi:predicted phage tail protein
MNDKVENLVLEQLRHMRSKIDQVYDAVQTLNVEMHAFRHHLRGNELDIDIDIDTHRDSIVKLQSRVDRIEKRLELVDEK